MWIADLRASVVVFLIALPLCLGVALASGMPPEAGLLSAIIGGIVVGAFAGSPFQVSGPAAGLSFLVWQLSTQLGLAGFFCCVVLAGVLQVVAGWLAMGRMFQATPPAVVHGMLAAIGIMILGTQLHVVLGESPAGSIMQNIASLPRTIWDSVAPSADPSHIMAAGVGLLTILVMVFWGLITMRILKGVPPVLVAIVTSSFVAWFFDLPIAYVSVPANLLRDVKLWLPTPELLLNSAIWIGAGSIALVASAETLLCAAAVDKLKRESKTQYNQELMAQGLGNLSCGLVGGLPLTGVIVRSRVNIRAGARSRLSTIFHGAWILIFVAAIPGVLKLIPIPALAAILALTGYDLVVESTKKMWGRVALANLGIFVVTIGAILATDLVKGVLVGVALSLVKLLYFLSHLKVHFAEKADGTVHIELFGAVTFLQLPKLDDYLNKVPAKSVVHISLERASYVDHACLEHLSTFQEQHEEGGGRCDIAWHTPSH